MNIRQTFSIRGNKWQTRYRIGLKDDRGRPVYGLCDFDRRIIFIERHMTMLEKEWVWSHEYMHAQLFESGIIKNSVAISAMAEEIVCNIFADIITKELVSRWRPKKRA